MTDNSNGDKEIPLTNPDLIGFNGVRAHDYATLFIMNKIERSCMVVMNREHALLDKHFPGLNALQIAGHVCHSQYSTEPTDPETVEAYAFFRHQVLSASKSRYN